MINPQIPQIAPFDMLRALKAVRKIERQIVTAANGRTQCFGHCRDQGLRVNL